MEKRVPAQEFVGKTFGRLTIVKILPQRKSGGICFEAICSCGQTKIVKREHLRVKDVVSCGCQGQEKRFKADSLIGIRDGKLTITKLLKCANNGYSSNSLYEAICDCGETCQITGKSFGGDRRSCGCLRLDAINARSDMPSGKQSVVNYIYSGYRSSARDRGLKFQLSISDFTSLVLGNCCYCGSLPTNKKIDRNGEIVLVNGVDRKNNKIGYNVDNCVPCCFKCNRMKHIYEYADFLEHISRIYKHIVINEESNVRS